MSEPILCVSWNNHANELAVGWKTLLENNSFVDCTIAAEGKSLKAHRLILSACSPYFQMLFNEEKEKHPIVILKDTVFHTLKILIDFVYNGKADIPASQLRSFLELTETLQIKGLNNSLRNDRIINSLGHADGRVQQCTFSANQGSCRDESSSTAPGNNFSNSLRQCHSRFSHGNASSTQQVFSTPVEGWSDPTETVQSRPVMMHPQDDRNIPMHYSPVVPENSDVCVKEEDFMSEIEILETKYKLLEDDNRVEVMSGNSGGEMNKGSAPAVVENLDQHSYGRESLHANSALVQHLQQQQQQQPSHEKQLQQQQQQPHGKQLQQQQQQPHERQLQQQQPHEQQLQQQQQTHEQQKQLHGQQLQQQQQPKEQQQQVLSSACELSLTSKQTEQSDPEPLELSVPLSDSAADSESEGSPDALDLPGSDAKEIEPSLDGNLDSNCAGSPPHSADEDQALAERRPAPKATQLQPRVRLSRMQLLECRACSAVFPSSQALQEHSRQHPPCAGSALAPQHSAQRPHPCDVCGKSFAAEAALARHVCRLKRERAYACDVFGKGFSKAAALAHHKQRHQRNKSHSCNVCGKRFACKRNVTVHKRIHTGERPYSCDVCGKAFAQSSHLTYHKRLHTGERPYSCDVCGKAFTHSSQLIYHKRLHTGERPYSCDVCGKDFAHLSHFTYHKRLHTGERPYSCDVCGKDFAHLTNLTYHKRLHTGERPYSCDVCGKAFAISNHLTNHKRVHSGERPFGCGACPLRFKSKSSMNLHRKRFHEKK